MAKQRLTQDTSLPARTNLSPDEVIRLMDFCLSATYIPGLPKHLQTSGTAMGSLVSVTVANLVMEDVEGQAPASYPTPPPFWKHYVDDTYWPFPRTKSQPSTYLNTIEPSIQFTVEFKENEELPFLDTLITHHPDGSLSTRVYRKKTHTDKYLHFNPTIHSLIG